MDFTIDTWGEILAALGVLGIVLGALDWRIRGAVERHVADVKSEIKKDVLEATRPIQPGYRNGGESLADVAALTRKIAEKVGIYDEE